MLNKTVFLSLLLWLGMLSNVSAATDQSVNIVGVQGYDLVSYHTSKRPLRGNGHFISEQNGVTYQFSSSANKQAFDANPDKYLPAYGGYCAFGVSVGKKFVGDPEVWRVVNGKLYLNLDANIQDDWLKDVPGRIKSADKHWTRIKNVPAADL